MSPEENQPSPDEIVELSDDQMRMPPRTERGTFAWLGNRLNEQIEPALEQVRSDLDKKTTHIKFLHEQIGELEASLESVRARLATVRQGIEIGLSKIGSKELESWQQELNAGLESINQEIAAIQSQIHEIQESSAESELEGEIIKQQASQEKSRLMDIRSIVRRLEDIQSEQAEVSRQIKQLEDEISKVESRQYPYTALDAEDKAQKIWELNQEVKNHKSKASELSAEHGDLLAQLTKANPDLAERYALFGQTLKTKDSVPNALIVDSSTESGDSVLEPDVSDESKVEVGQDEKGLVESDDSTTPASDSSDTQIDGINNQQVEAMINEGSPVLPVGHTPGELIETATAATETATDVGQLDPQIELDDTQPNNVAETATLEAPTRERQINREAEQSLGLALGELSAKLGVTEVKLRQLIDQMVDSEITFDEGERKIDGKNWIANEILSELSSSNQPIPDRIRGNDEELKAFLLELWNSGEAGRVERLSLLDRMPSLPSPTEWLRKLGGNKEEKITKIKAEIKNLKKDLPEEGKEGYKSDAAYNEYYQNKLKLLEKELDRLENSGFPGKALWKRFRAGVSNYQQAQQERSQARAQEREEAEAAKQRGEQEDQAEQMSAEKEQEKVQDREQIENKINDFLAKHLNDFNLRDLDHESNQNAYRELARLYNSILDFLRKWQGRPDWSELMHAIRLPYVAEDNKFNIARLSGTESFDQAKQVMSQQYQRSIEGIDLNKLVENDTHKTELLTSYSNFGGQDIERGINQ